MKPTTVPRQTSASAPAGTATRSFESVHLSTLRLNSVLPFVLYTRIEGEYIVYRRENLPFTSTQRQALLENDLEILFISSDQMEKYWEYLKGNIQRIIADSELELEERARMIYRSSRELTRQILDLPLTPVQISSARSLLSDSLKFLQEGKSSLHAMMREMETQPSLYSHALNVSQYGLALARQIGITDPVELEAMGLGLLCQDLGMLRIAQHLVFKTGALSFEEWAVIKRHPTLSLEAVEKIPGFPDLAKAIVFGHHERLDGSGYPRGLTGEELPVPLRVVGIVDVFTSLTCSRPFCDAATTFDALKTMKLEMPSAFDPRILDEFVRLLGF